MKLFSWLKSALSKLFQFKLFAGLMLSLTMLATVTAISFFILFFSDIRTKWIRHLTEHTVVKVTNEKNGVSGGTGFHVKTPNGHVYILTNAHVCDGIRLQEEQDVVVVTTLQGMSMPRRIIEISDIYDLCLIEPLPGINGLEMSSTLPQVGDSIIAAGYSQLTALSISIGEMTATRDKIGVLDHIMLNDSPEELAKCNKPKNAIVAADIESYMIFPICIVVVSSPIETTTTIFPGNSGSPALNNFGKVVGVFFASNSMNRGFVVDHRSVYEFLRLY